MQERRDGVFDCRVVEGPAGKCSSCNYNGTPSAGLTLSGPGQVSESNLPDRGRVRSRFYLGERRLMRPKDRRAETDQAEWCPSSMMVDLFGNVQTNGWRCCTMRFSGAAKERVCQWGKSSLRARRCVISIRR